MAELNLEYTIKMSAGVTPEMNLGESVVHRQRSMFASKIIHTSFETQEVKQGYQWPNKRIYVLQKFKIIFYP